MRPIAVTGFGVVSPLGIGEEVFAKGLCDASRDAFTSTSSLFDMAPYPNARVAEVAGFDPAPYVGDKGLRNNDRLTKLFLVAARTALDAAGVKKGGVWQALSPDATGVCASTAYGSLEAITELDRVAKLEDPRYLNPARFPNTVINSALGYVSIWEDLRALNVTVTNGTPGALDAVFCAGVHLDSLRARAVLVGGGEALSEALVLAFHRLEAIGPGGMRLGEGAALALLEPEALARARGARIRALVTGYGTAFTPPSTPDAPLVAPSARAVERAARAALADANVSPAEVDLVVSGVSGYALMDAPEFEALARVVPDACVTAPKARYGETLGAAGAFAMASACAWMSGTPVASVVRGSAPAEVRTALLTVAGFYGNASALVVRRAE